MKNFVYRNGSKRFYEAYSDVYYHYDTQYNCMPLQITLQKESVSVI